MFEQDAELVNTLLSSNRKFKELFDRHEVLKVQVRKAEQGTAVDDFTLGAMKKEKLLTKDKLAAIIDESRSN